MELFFLYSFSICLLFVYRKVSDFCKLILYPATLLKLFMVCRSFFFFWWRFLGLLGVRSCCLWIGIVSLLPYLFIFLLFHLPILLLWLVILRLLNRSGESGHPCLIPDFRGNGISFSPLRMMLVKDLSYIPFIIFPSIHFQTHENFLCMRYINQILSLPEILTLSILDSFFSLYPLLSTAHSNLWMLNSFI
jgi:hypothetical protein